MALDERPVEIHGRKEKRQSAGEKAGAVVALRGCALKFAVAPAFVYESVVAQVED